jgi:hypothetical protein
MAVPRPVLLALLGLALCATAFLATRGAREPGGTSVTAVPATLAPATHKAASAAKHAPAKPKHQAPAHKAAAPKPQPASAAQQRAVAVTQALGRGDAVVFFFTSPGAADDTGTRQAVESLLGRDHVMVVRAGLKDLTAFRPVLSGAGVSQVPAVVVAHAGKPARLLQGYVDPGTLRQTIADALR